MSSYPHRFLSLVGYRGSGKSTVARLVAAMLGWPWADADTLLEEKLGRTIREVFAAEGEARFRAYEQELLAELCLRHNLVLATGGGVILRPTNGVLLRQAGPVVWLRADPEELSRRLAADPTTEERRPALTSRGLHQEIAAVLEEREPLYRAIADLVLDTTSLPPDEAARRIFDWFRIAPPCLTARSNS